ncbi:dTDP-4-amino-4,6-dideoxygalactose transaminase [Cohnella sp. GCM10027633]|uniref:dTDP-4-amino-4,6-dideoxygalactose transaminase n=1 Tax=unclassified Cohnella TaxID=2636738 RepID=UPI00363CE7EA
MIPFNRAAITGGEWTYVQQAMSNRKLSGDGPFSKRCALWFEQRFRARKALLTTSCTHALEIAALLADVKPGDEVIMPSYTFVSTANAFVLRGATIVFVDVRPDTMNIDERLIERAITPRTKAIVPVHYAGVACEMDVIMELAAKYGLLVIEDAAQGVMSTYKGKALGTIGHIGCYSFHETKNYSCGEGGAILLNDERYFARAEILREKGTNRSRYFRGQVDKYTWVDVGSSYLPSELNAAFLYAQLENADAINENRLASWNRYYERLKPMENQGYIQLPIVPAECEHNSHLFFLRTGSLDERTALIEELSRKGVAASFHFVPLHETDAGKKYGRFSGTDLHTTANSERLLRLPLYYELTDEEIDQVVDAVCSFYEKYSPEAFESRASSAV